LRVQRKLIWWDATEGHTIGSYQKEEKCVSVCDYNEVNKHTGELLREAYLDYETNNALLMIGISCSEAAATES
jgi:hypothetical protein